MGRVEMGWRDLLEAEGETIVAPWIFGRTVHLGSRSFKLGKTPDERGWYHFKVRGRSVEVGAPAEPDEGAFVEVITGHLVGDRLVSDEAVVELDAAQIAAQAERVHLLELGLDRFVRISAGRVSPGGPLIFKEEEMPLGPEEEVLAAWQDEKESVDHVRGVTPALDAAFQLECWRREEAKKRRERAELARRRRELAETLGDGERRRQMAHVDFEAAARAALAVGGASYLEHRPAAARGEMVVRFRWDGRRFECTCDAHTLQIIDAGICLIDHNTEERGDTYFTLESLPGVIQQADRDGVLVVFRHI